MEKIIAIVSGALVGLLIFLTFFVGGMLTHWEVFSVNQFENFLIFLVIAISVMETTDVVLESPRGDFLVNIVLSAVVSALFVAAMYGLTGNLGWYGPDVLNKYGAWMGIFIVGSAIIAATSKTWVRNKRQK